MYHLGVKVGNLQATNNSTEFAAFRLRSSRQVGYILTQGDS